jgi:TusA-related sulfurtransferase
LSTPSTDQPNAGAAGEASLDLCGTPCPLNYIRSKLALEKLESGAWLQVDLDAGEPEQMVMAGLRDAGHRVEREPLQPGIVRLRIRRDG